MEFVSGDDVLERLFINLETSTSAPVDNNYFVGCLLSKPIIKLHFLDGWSLSSSCGVLGQSR